MRKWILAEVIIAFLPITTIYCIGLSMLLPIVFIPATYREMDWSLLRPLLALPLGALGLWGVCRVTQDVALSSRKPTQLGLKYLLLGAGTAGLVLVSYSSMLHPAWESLIVYLPLLVIAHLSWLLFRDAQTRSPDQ